jgi:hypothetical protein
MKRFILIPAVLLFVSLILSINFVWASSTMWTKTYGTGNAAAYSMVMTSDGGYALAGDGLLVKTDASGDMEWNETYLGGLIYSVVQTSDGGYALGGTAESLNGDYDFWLVKTDAQGIMLWNKTYGGPDNEAANSPNSLVETSDGGLALAGYTSIFYEYSDFWLVKTDELGNMQWDQTYGEAGDEQIYSLVETSDGAYVLAGYKTSTYAGLGDMWLIKTDSHGNIPEFPSWIMLPFFLIATIAGIICKKRLTSKRSAR